MSPIMSNVIELFKAKKTILQFSIDGEFPVFQFRKDGNGGYLAANNASESLCKILLERDVLSAEDIENIEALFKKVEIVPLALIE